MSTLTDRWYEEKAPTADQIVKAVSRCADQLTSRRKNDRDWLKMYGQSDIYGEGLTEVHGLDPTRLSFNITRAVVKTAQAHIGTIRPTPKFQTNDGDWTLGRRAKKCEDTVKAVFYDQQYHELSSHAFVDACVCSLGAIKVYGQDGKVRLERVLPGEIIVDLEESYRGNPTSLYQVMPVDRDRLKSQWRGKERQIDQCAGESRNLFPWIKQPFTSNRIDVIEGWHLPTKNSDGRHVITIANDILYQEPWTRDCFPFSFYRWERRQAGFYGMGIVEELRYHQRNLNLLDIVISRILQFNASPKILIPGTARINEEHLDNDPGRALRWSGNGPPPQVWTQNMVPTELFQERQTIIESAFRQVGVNRMQMSGEKPPGIQAAVALRELNDQGSKRFRQNVYAFEQFAIDTAKLIIQELGEMAEKGSLDKIKTKTRKRSFYVLEDVDWKEYALAPEEYKLEVQSASSLPDSTPGRIQTVQDWYSAGFINQLEAKHLLQFTDIEGFQNLDLAPYHVILDSIETIIEDGEYVFPEPTDHLELAVKLATLSYAKFRLRKAPTDRLELLLQYIDDVKWLQSQAMAGATQAQQSAAAIGPAVAGLQQQIPGVSGGYEAARLLEAGANIQQQPQQGPPPQQQLPPQP